MVRLETEQGRDVVATLSDTQDLLHRILPPPTDQSYRCLGFIDWYGEAMFNHLQMDSLVAELQRIRLAATSGEESALLDEIRVLAERCRAEDGLMYLWFYGD
jgi:hypothetical protein